MQQNNREEADPNFDRDVNRFISTVLMQENEDLPPSSLCSSDIKNNKLLHEINDGFYNFYHIFRNGLIIAYKDEELTGYAVPPIPEETLALFQNTDAFINALEQGKSIYQLLGLNTEILLHFYENALRLVESNDYEKAYAVLYFLVTIAPEIAPFWFALGLCSEVLQNEEAAADAFLQSIELDEQNGTAYQAYVSTLIKLQRPDEAYNFCVEKIAELASLSDAWAQKLISILEQMKLQIQG